MIRMPKGEEGHLFLEPASKGVMVSDSLVEADVVFGQPRGNGETSSDARRVGQTRPPAAAASLLLTSWLLLIVCVVGALCRGPATLPLRATGAGGGRLSDCTVIHE